MLDDKTAPASQDDVAEANVDSIDEASGVSDAEQAASPLIGAF